MAQLDHLIEEIKELRNETNHRASLRISNILESHQKQFLEKIESPVFVQLLKNFESLSQSNSRDYGTDDYKAEYRKYYENLMFYLNRII